MIVEVGGADQREVVLVGDGEEDAAVGVLEDVAAVVLVQPRHDDVAALAPAAPLARGCRRSASGQHLADPGPGGIDQRAGRGPRARAPCRVAAASAASRRPRARPPTQRGARARSSAPRSAASRAFSTTRRASSTQQSEYSKPRSERRLERRARPGRARRSTRRGSAAAACGRRDGRTGTGRAAASRPGRSPVWCGSTKRSGQMMCGAMRQQHLALEQRLAHQPELVIFEIAQAAMDQLGGGRRGAAGEVVLLAQADRQAAPGRVARDAAAVDAAADDQRGRRSDRAILPLPAFSRFFGSDPIPTQNRTASEHLQHQIRPARSGPPRFHHLTSCARHSSAAAASSRSVTRTSTCRRVCEPHRAPGAPNLLLSVTRTTRRACSMMARGDPDLAQVEVEQRAVGVDRRGADDGGIDPELADHVHRAAPITPPSARRTVPPAITTSMPGCGTARSRHAGCW